MYLSENKTLRMMTLCGLYIAQGVPWGFVTVTFAAWLAQPKHNLSVEQLGPILAVATLPWSFKFLWGPLMDRYSIRRFGRRRPWIIFAQSMAVLVLGSLAFFDDLPAMVWTESPTGGSWKEVAYKFVPGPLAAMILLANVFVSMQDVAVDALAVDLLKEQERGIANGLMYGSSYLGTAIGGAGLGYVVAIYGIEAGLLGQALLLGLIMILPLLFAERRSDSTALDLNLSDAEGSTETPAERTVESSSIDFAESPLMPPVNQPAVGSQAASQSVIWNLFLAFRLRSTLIGALVATSVRIGIGVLTAVFVDHLMKEGGWAQEEYTAITGGYAVGVGLIGSALGGFIADKVGPKPMIVTTSILLGLMWVIFGIVPGLLESKFAITGMLIGQEFLLAVMTVSLFSLFMGISWPPVAATQFTTYMALMNLSTTIGSYIAGILSQQLNIFQILVVAGIVQAVLILPVLLIDPKQTRRVLGDE